MTNNNIKVSIIVPIYNVEPYLKKCLDSLVNQTIANDIEIICINDCSPDNCLDILKEYQEKYSDRLIKIINHKENTGVAIARNDGLSIAQGEYLGFVDPDDWVDLNFFEVLYNKGIESGADMVRGIFKEISDNISGIKLNNSRTFNKDSLSIFREGGFWSFIYKAKMLKEQKIVFPDLRNCQDMVFLLKAIFSAKNIENVNNVCYYYFRRQNSSTDGLSDTRILCEMKKIQIMADFINMADISKDKYIEFFNIFFNDSFYLFYGCNEYKKLYYQNDIIRNIFDLYEKCKYKLDYKKEHYEEYIDYIEVKDLTALKRYLNGNKKLNIRFLNIPVLKIKNKIEKKYIYLLNLIPFLKIKQNNTRIKIYLFNFIPLLTIKRK